MIEFRHKILFYAGVGVLTLVMVRMVHLQVFKGNEFARQAFHSHYRRVNIEPQRGSIVDRHGRLLAATVINDSVYADPVQIKHPASTADILGKILNKNTRKLEKLFQQNKKRFVWVQRSVTPGQASRIVDSELPGIFFRRDSRRVYPAGELMAAVLGFTGVDGHGLAGLEASLDAGLSGTTGQDLQAFDALARPYSPDKITLKSPVQGKDIQLTIDKTIQYFAATAIRRMVEKENAQWGAVVVMNSATGEVLAMASEPTFNPHSFNDFPSESRRNRCVSQVLEPGSTFKSVTLAAALESRTLDLESTIDCQNGEITVENATYSDWKPFSTLSLKDVIVFSSNVGTIKMANSAGASSLLNLSKKLGFGSLRIQDLPGVEAGYLRSTCLHSPTALASLSIGYGIAVTPLQLAATYATFSNGGYRIEPYIIKSAQICPKQRVLSPETAEMVKTVLAETVSHGTGKKAQPEGYSAGGKTGTARRYNTETGRYDTNRVTCVFAGFAPAENPLLSICVVIDDPQKNKWASTVSAKVFSEIVSRTLLYLGESPERKIAA